MELSELNEKLKAECNSLKEKQAKFQEERGTLKEQIYAAKRNATKREKRRVVVVEKQKETIKIIEKRLRSSETNRKTEIKIEQGKPSCSILEVKSVQYTSRFC